MSSGYSDDDSVIIRRELDCAEDTIVSNSEDEDVSPDPLFHSDKLLARTVEKSEPIESNPPKASDFVTIKQNNWGPHFDVHLASSLDKIQSFNNELRNPRTLTGGQDRNKTRLMSQLKNKQVSPQYLDLIVKENISGRYSDWHFITENSEFQDVSIEQELLADEKGKIVQEDIRVLYPSLKCFLNSIGVSDLTMRSLEAPSPKPLTANRRFDSLCDISPVESMMRAFEAYSDNGRYFLKSLICFILDRKIWESMECDAHWCHNVLAKFTTQQVLDEYLLLVERKDYFMHYRFVRSFPHLQLALVQHLINPVKTQAIVEEFERLMEEKAYQPLLYFTLLVYGSRLMPFGNSSTTLYLKECTEDLCNESTNAVELSLLRGILGLFLKIT
ncbi:uncharacterized protein ZBAI_03629 [Zygosaccharomyces bailii ISA1307]|nr:uncharacterized protein ZBAI_03629 [Zygosaccharomyces bailii ISA1307]